MAMHAIDEGMGLLLCSDVLLANVCAPERCAIFMVQASTVLASRYACPSENYFVECTRNEATTFQDRQTNHLLGQGEILSSN